MEMKLILLVFILVTQKNIDNKTRLVVSY